MTYLDQECNSLTTIQKTVIVGESEVHHLPANVSEIEIPIKVIYWGRGVTYRADFDLAVDGDRLILDGVKTQDSCKESVRPQETHKKWWNLPV
jgi:hypothetical protein